MNQQPTSSRARSERPINIDPFLLKMNKVSHSSNVVELRILRKKAEIKKHKKKLANIEYRIEKMFKQRKTVEGELYLAEMDLSVLQEGYENGSDSD